MLPRPPRPTLFPTRRSSDLFNSKDRNPLHRTLFSVASLVITVQGTGLAFSLLGGTGSAMPLSALDRKSTRLNSSHLGISYAVFCLKKKKIYGTHVTHHSHAH